MHYLVRNVSYADQELYELLRMFYSDAEASLVNEPAELGPEDEQYRCEVENGIVILCRAMAVGTESRRKACALTGDSLIDQRTKKNALKTLLYGFLTEHGAKLPGWGMLTGIKPVMLMRRALADHNEPNEALSYMKDTYKLGEAKLKLLYDTALVQASVVSEPDTAFSVYIHVPFCPGKCLYCSFLSDTAARCQKDMGAYLHAVAFEFEAARPILDMRPVETVYMGGGTPTSLNDEDFGKLLQTVTRHIDTAALREFTVEAGRADTINRVKLRLMKNAGVTRISINPQTMKNETLFAIGRGHTAEEVEAAFKMAREEGFYNINADVIAGLPLETPKDFENTLNRLLKLKPEGLTVHTLSVKRASSLKENKELYSMTEAAAVEEMLAFADRVLRGEGYRPYYLYRQKNTIGNLENVGYALPEKESIYNIKMMEEVQSIVAFGAGGISKALLPNNRIERCANAKNHRTYIDDTAYYTAKKDRLFEKLKGDVSYNE